MHAFSHNLNSPDVTFPAPGGCCFYQKLTTGSQSNPKVTQLKTMHALVRRRRWEGAIRPAFSLRLRTEPGVSASLGPGVREGGGGIHTVQADRHTERGGEEV